MMARPGGSQWTGKPGDTHQSINQRRPAQKFDLAAGGSVSPTRYNSKSTQQDAALIVRNDQPQSARRARRSRAGTATPPASGFRRRHRNPLIGSQARPARLYNDGLS
jgi:hypothetical protein